MSDRKQLQEQYEDALFALLMDRVAEREGQELLREAERLNNDPSAAIPEDLDRKCRKIIRGARRKETAAKTCRVTTRVLKKVAIAVVAAILLLAIACAANSGFRAKILNFLKSNTDEYTQFQFGDKKPFEDTPGVVDTSLCVYSVPDKLAGVERTYAVESDKERVYRYGSSEHSTLTVRIEYADRNTIYMVDSEEADLSLDIQINGYNGVYTEKDRSVLVAWVDTDRGIVVSVLANGLDGAAALDAARAIELTDK